MTSTTKNVLIGCLAAVAAALVLGVSSCVGFVVWLYRPGQLLDPGKLVDADTTGYIEWTLRLDDPGCRKLFDQLVELHGFGPRERLLLETAAWAAHSSRWCGILFMICLSTARLLTKFCE